MNKTLVLDTHAEPLPAREALLLMLEPSSFDTINAENHTFALPYLTGDAVAAASQTTVLVQR
jgi:hypothetical protein